MGQPPTDSPLLDSSEQVYISSLALLKMLKHGAWILPLFPAPPIPSNLGLGFVSVPPPPPPPPPPPAPGGGWFSPSPPPPPLSGTDALFSVAGRAGVPMEVMGLMLGEFVDDYTVRVVDVFAMPQSGTGVSVEAVDHVFQTNMLDMLKQTGR